MEDNNGFIAIDLHVHTPASNCYKMHENTDGEYIKIVEHYVKEGVKVMAITDHNTCSGYTKMMEVREEINSMVELLEKNGSCLGHQSQDLAYYKDLSDNFNQLLILPGVEVEVNPGIHFLLVFNPNMKIDEINNLLSEIGYDSDSYGSEETGNIETDIMKMLSLISNYDALVIAAHIDSNKGIYKDLSKGRYRAQVFSDKRIHGLQIVNQKTADIISSLYEQKEYRRETSIAYIRGTDFHGDFSEKLDPFYAKMENINYDDLKKAFLTPEISISISKHPEFKEIIEKILVLENTIVMKDMDDEGVKLDKALCSLINKRQGYLVVGVSENSHRNFLGTALDIEDVEKKIRKSYQNLNTENSNSNLQVRKVDWGNKNIYIISITSNSSVLTVTNDGEVYIINKGNCELASNKQIIYETQNKIIDHLGKYISKNQNRIEELTNELTLYSEFNNCFSTLIKIDIQGFKLGNLCKVKLLKENDYADLVRTDGIGKYPNNVLIPTNLGPRLSSSYLRFSPPGNYIDDINQYKTYTGKYILLVSNGASYYVNREDKHCISRVEEGNVLKISIRDEYIDMFPYELLIAWLRSSLFIFYSYVKNNKTSIYSPMNFKESPIIKRSEISNCEAIIENTKKLIMLEHDFVQNLHSDCNYDCDNCICTEEKKDKIHKVINEKIKRFNNSVESIVYENDEIFYDVFKISDENRQTVNKLLKNKNLYVYNRIIDDEDFNK